MFDKTGTLTNGSFTVTAVHPDKVSKEAAGDGGAGGGIATIP